MRFFTMTACALFALPAIGQINCPDLMKLALPGVTIREAAPGTRAGVPAHCRVVGVITPEVNFEVWLPANWNRKFLMVGNGGLAGSINTAAMVDPLQRGYATASTDTGHAADQDAHWAQGHLQRVIDFAPRGVHVTTVASKAILRAHYGSAAQHSYFSGCSQGGQEALTEAQRYPDDYDGIIAGDPANYWTHLYMGGHLWIAQATMKDPASYIPATKVPLLANAVNTACDALDGIKDGILNDPRRCHFDPAVLTCKNGDAPDCLTLPQVEAARRIYQGARTAAGEEIFPGIMPGGEGGAGGWSRWITGTDPGRGSHMTLGFPFLAYVAFEDPAWDFRTFKFDRVNGFDSDVDFIDAKLGPIFDNMNPDLSAFQAHGGKLIQYHGWSDPDISPLNSIHYYDSVVSRNRSIARTQDFYRLFMVPGMQHCGGGPGPDTFDMISALDAWVTANKAPEKVVASHFTNGVEDRTRPLCPYPQEARHTGTGSTDRAESFSCVRP